LLPLDSCRLLLRGRLLGLPALQSRSVVRAGLFPPAVLVQPRLVLSPRLRGLVRVQLPVRQPVLGQLLFRQLLLTVLHRPGLLSLVQVRTPVPRPVLCPCPLASPARCRLAAGSA